MEVILTQGFLEKVNIECAWRHDDHDDDYYDDTTVQNLQCTFMTNLCVFYQYEKLLLIWDDYYSEDVRVCVYVYLTQYVGLENIRY